MPDPVELTSLHQKLDYHYPRSYLLAWAQGVRPDWALFLHSVFSQDVPELLPELSGGHGLVMDLGCGPSIANIISASNWSDKIYMAELLEGNRKEIVKYLCQDDDAWDWRPYFQFHTELEGGQEPDMVEQRVRKSITGILECDLSSDQVFRPEVFDQQVDIMICSLVFDVVCTDTENFKVVLGRALKYLQPAGLMVVQGSLGEHNYAVGSAMFPTLDITQEEFMEVIRTEGLEVVKWETTVRCSTHYFAILRRNTVTS